MRTLNRLMLAGLLAFAPLVAMAADDDAPSGEPDVTIRQEGDKTIQEYRVNGFLYAIKVPKHGKPYFWSALTAAMATSFAPTSRTS